MTIAYIKSNTLRRTLIVVLLPFLPIVFSILAAVRAADAFIEEMKDQCNWGRGAVGGLWASIRDCWNGVDVGRR